MSDAETTIIVLVIVLALLIWVLYLAAALVMWFTAFVLELHPFLSILMFILFPPTLIVFLVGLAFIWLGLRKEEASDQYQVSESVRKGEDKKRLEKYSDD